MSDTPDQKQKPITKADYWACACVKRDKAGNPTSIGLNHPTVKRCRRCHATKPE